MGPSGYAITIVIHRLSDPNNLDQWFFTNHYLNLIGTDLMNTFKELSLSPEITRALETLGFETPTEIQSKAIPILLQKEQIDFHGQAQTGTGKTLAFGIPLLQTIQPSEKHVQALIVAPTRELVLQICQSLRSVGQYMNLTIEPIYGGVSMHEQISALRRGVHIVVGTPGRLNDHLRRKTLQLKTLKTLVLDEADIMLDMGFKEEVDEILTYAPENRQIWLFSATVKPGISQIMSEHMNNPVSVRTSKQAVGSANTKQYFCMIPMRDRLVALTRFVDTIPSMYAIVFCQTKLLTAEIAERLNLEGYNAKALHGDMSQVQRNKVIKQFKAREFNILVATDVAARGIDVSDLTHVINYSLPDDQESYVHRIGRTGRAGKEGVAITFINKGDMSHFSRLKRKFNFEVNPLDVPTMETIAQVRVADAAEYLVTACHSKHNESYTKQLQALALEYSPEELANAVVALLDDKFFKLLKKKDEVKFIPGSQVSMDDASYNTSNDDMQELVLHVGIDDGVTKSDVVNYIQKYSQLNQEQIAKIKVIKRRSFVVVGKDMARDLLSSLIGKELNGRRIRVDFTNEPAQSSRGGRDRSFGGGRRRSA